MSEIKTQKQFEVLTQETQAALLRDNKRRSKELIQEFRALSKQRRKWLGKTSPAYILRLEGETKQILDDWSLLTGKHKSEVIRPAIEKEARKLERILEGGDI
jgi:hypothetical protein